MPLVMPEMLGGKKGEGDQSSDWLNKLAGKKIGDTSDNLTFAKTDLPSKHRIIKEGEMSTTDHDPERLNIHVAEDGTVRKVTHG